MGSFFKHAEGFREVCAQHNHVERSDGKVVVMNPSRPSRIA
jgi:hypothetical protein